MAARQQFESIFGIKLTKSKHLELLGILVCMEIVLAFSYLGYIQISLLSVTTLHILVIVAAMFFGPLDAVLVAAIFGITSMWKASVSSLSAGDIIFSPTLSGKPAESIIMALGARVLFAFLTGMAFRMYFSQKRKHPGIGISVITVLSTLFHLLIVFICMNSFFGNVIIASEVGTDSTLFINNVILVLLSVGIVLFSYRIFTFNRIQIFFRKTSIEEAQISKNRSSIVIFMYLILVACAVFIAVHFMTRLGLYIREQGQDVSEEYISWTYSLLLQFIVGFIGVFGVLTIAVRWIQEYYSALTVEANVRARMNAEIANASKTSFLFNMSHDIRTPMNAVVGFTGMAMKHIDEKEKALDCLRKAQDSGNLLLSLINNILDVSRIESGKAMLEEKAGDICDSFSGLEGTMLEMAAGKDITLTFEYSNIRNRYVMYDPNRCLRIFVNIISNAIKYTNEGGFVRVRCEQKGDIEEGKATFCYTFEDNGIGMSEEFQKHVFEQFSREETATVSGIQGSGLGMAVCKSLVNLMGGTIECYSVQGEGTTFTVILPFKTVDEADISELLKTSDNNDNSINDDNIIHNSDEKILLLVEDNELNREIAEEILSEAGYLVESACNGAEAVDIIKDKGTDYYQCILMDIQMPVMNGYEATKNIRKMYPDKHIPIIALSANAFEEDRLASMAAGMDAHVAKPIDIDELTKALSGVI